MSQPGLQEASARAAFSFEISELRSRLRSEIAWRQRLQGELDLRNSALDAAGSHFMIADARRPYAPTIYVNRAMAQACGYEPSQMLGMSLDDFFPREFNSARLAEVHDALRRGIAIRTEMLASRKDGSTFWAGISLTFLRDAQGRITHTVGVGADITARLEQERVQKALQEQLYSEMQQRELIAIELRLAQKLESVGRLAAGIAHEINTPIQYVGDSVSFLQSASKDLERLRAGYRSALEQLVGAEAAAAVLVQVRDVGEVAEVAFLVAEIPKAFERTLEGVERVAKIVSAMREFAHPDTQEHSLADLNHAIETTLIVASNEYKYSAALETQLGALPEVKCNVGELNQVFLNLIVNAAHTIRESGKEPATGRITIATTVAGAAVVISIADNGCGISADNIEKIFDPFFTTKPVGMGTGQGLAIARSIVVERHGGTIDVRSVLGEGTVFIVSLPIAGRPSPQAV
jgi:PAS domain S-box-containing protein